MTNTATARVYDFETQEMKESRMLKDHIYGFLNTMERRSENTRNVYERYIRQFFRMMRDKEEGKEIETLTFADFDFDKRFVRKYLEMIESEKDVKNSTVLNMLAPMKSLLDDMKGIKDFKEIINTYAFKKLNIKKDTVKIGVLHMFELLRMMEALTTKSNGFVKATMLYFAAVTSFRFDSIIKLTLNDFVKINENVYQVTVIGRNAKNGEDDKKSIYADLYERLVKCKEIMNPHGDEIFKLSNSYANRMIHQLVDELGLDPQDSRSLSFHSLKKCGMEEVYIQSQGDLKKIQQQGGHKHVQTSMQHYIDFQYDPLQSPSLLVGKQIDLEPIKAMSHDELISKIESMPRDLQLAILSYM